MGTAPAAAINLAGRHLTQKTSRAGATEPRQDRASGAFPQGFNAAGGTGELRWLSAGLCRQRLSPALSRFISADTLVLDTASFGALNRYSHFLGSPT